MIRRTYMCPECANRWEVEIDGDQWDAPPPSCTACDAREVHQEFKPPAINGSIAARAASITENIIRNDYGVANYVPDNRQGGTGKTRYNDAPSGSVGGSQWAGNMLQEAIQIGRKTRMEGGSGLDILQRNLRDGTQTDLIEASKRKAIKVW